MADIEEIKQLAAAREAAGQPIDEDAFEEGVAPKDMKTAHHIRANSSIMHLSKILGEYSKPLRANFLPGRPSILKLTNISLNSGQQRRDP